LDALGLIGFAAALSVNLAVLNSLPIPALDGGQLVFVLAELVFGKLPRKAVQGVTAFGFSLMLALGLTTFLGDVSKLGGMLPPPNVVESNSRKE
jgi:membrane-associated protease RseP (regulator of RpoE activity)